MGNGLRADVWETFQKRFGPIRIWEFYGSTEGNVGFVNYPGHCGAVGKTNYLLRVSGWCTHVIVALTEADPTGPLPRLPPLPPRCCLPLSLFSLTWKQRNL